MQEQVDITMSKNRRYTYYTTVIAMQEQVDITMSKNRHYTYYTTVIAMNMLKHCCEYFT